MSQIASIIVLNYQGRGLLDACLTSLASQTYRDMEVLVVDNGSTERSEEVAARYPVRWEGLGRNFGFARGNNLGVQRAKGDIVVFVNNDMRFAKDFVGELVQPLLRDAQVFATDALQFDWSGTSAVHLATQLVRRRGGLAGPLVAFDIEQRQVEGPTDVFQTCSANMAVRRSMFEALGGFDPRLPAGWEDTEICWRAWLQAWRSVFVPSAICWHKVGASSTQGPGEWMRYRGSLGGRLLFATKHLPVEDGLAVWGSSIAALIRDLVRFRWAASRRRTRVMIEFAKHVPGAIRERRDLYRRVGRTPRQHLDWLTQEMSRL